MPINLPPLILEIDILLLHRGRKMPGGNINLSAISELIFKIDRYFSQGMEDPTYPYIVFTVVGFIGIVSTSFGEILPRT